MFTVLLTVQIEVLKKGLNKATVNKKRNHVDYFIEEVFPVVVASSDSSILNVDVEWAHKKTWCVRRISNERRSWFTKKMTEFGRPKILPVYIFFLVSQLLSERMELEMLILIHF